MILSEKYAKIHLESKTGDRPVFCLKNMDKVRRKRNKRKIKRKKAKTPKNMRGTSAPEYFLFGFLIVGALLVSVASFESSWKIPTSFTSVDYSSGKAALENRIQSLTRGYPIEEMSPLISRKNQRVASFLVAIAKKESNWGRHAPEKDGEQCYNYWGYRGPENPTDSGYSCFDSPEQAVDVVGGRIKKLMTEKIDTPKEMIIWKCGETNCSRYDHGAAKWIWDVDYYFKKIYPGKSKPAKPIAYDIKK